MKKKTLLSVMLASVLSAGAHQTPKDSILEMPSSTLLRLTPVESPYFVEMGKVSRHWFVGLQAGTSAFIGSPVGCGDLFDRMSPVFNVYGGKWVNPSVAVRAAFQGLSFKDAGLAKRSYQLYHADLMYNVSPLFRNPSEQLPKWDLIPYLGLGMAHTTLTNASCGCVAPNHHFALSYGMQARYLLNRNVHATMEVGGFSTFKNFDRNGSVRSFGDNMLSLSLGISYSFGDSRWRHAVDAAPYMDQYDYYVSYTNGLEETNASLRRQHDIDNRILGELKKILAIEGLLDKYRYLFDDRGEENYNYHGLVALKKRMEARDNTTSVSTEGIGQAVNGSEELISIPVYFFFKLGKAKLTDESQLINLDELAKVSLAHNLRIRIEGAADRATGTGELNNGLGKKRARYIADELKKRGVSAEFIQGKSLGGINQYEEPKDNRYCRVSVYLEFGGN